MTLVEFRTQLQRLTSQFGQTNYSEERVRLIFQEVSSLEVGQWKNIVDRLIAESRFPPLLPDIREAMSLEREKKWRHEKAQHQKDAEEFFVSAISNDEKTIMAQTIKDRMFNRIDDAQWEKFLADLNRATDQKNYRTV